MSEQSIVAKQYGNAADRQAAGAALAFDTTAAAGDCNLIMMDRPSSPPLLLPAYTVSVYEAVQSGDLISDRTASVTSTTP